MLAILDIADYETLQAIADQAEETGVYWGRKIFLGSVVDLSLGHNRRVLLAMARDGMIRLSRADLVAAMDPVMVARSEMEIDGAVFHFLEFVML